MSAEAGRVTRRLNTKAGRLLLGAALVAAALPIIANRSADDSAGAAESTIRDGSTMARAALSCWSAKKLAPTAPSGAFWILTPQMQVPKQVYCDQTTDGGGWALIGRGREGWNFNDGGQGDLGKLVTTPTGTDAFAPAAFPATTVNGLLNGMTVDQLTEGVRLRMAADVAGTTWQEARWIYSSAVPWHWTMSGAYPLSSASTLDGVAGLSGAAAGSVGTTNDAYMANGKRIWTYSWSGNNGVQGFNNAYGVHGSSAATSYLWEYGTASVASPFTQVFIRPKLVEGAAQAGETSVTFPSVPDTGLAAAPNTVKPAISSKPVSTGWGVTGRYDPNDQYPNVYAFVTTIKIVGNIVFVGGKFNNLQNGANGPLVAQPYLAAFDRTTGAWISSFRPVLDGAVWALEATPDNKLLVAGNFSSINGVANTAGIFKLDPATMAPDPTFALTLTRTTGRTIGRSISIKGDWAYLAGRFNNAVGGPAGVSNLGIGGLLKFKWADGTPEPNWRPYTDKTVESIFASPTSDRLWIAGYFLNVSGSPAPEVSSLSLVTGQRNEPATLTANLDASPQMAYKKSASEPEWTIAEWNGNVYQGGTEHYFGRHRPSDYFQTAYTTQANGDYQTQEFFGGLVYAGCHCGTANKTQQVDGQLVGTGLISAFGAWDPDTFVRTATFNPDLRNWNIGPWAMEADEQAGCLWVGGDFGAGPSDSYLSGFARFCIPGGPADMTPPTTPAPASGTLDASGTHLTWTASTDNSGGSISYEILDEDRVVGTTSSTTWNGTSLTAGRYFVRAVDAAGNRSATTSVIVPLDTQPLTIAAFGTAWQVAPAGTTPPANWQTTGALAGWTSTTAPLGAGGIGEVSTITLNGPTTYIARDVNVSDVSTLGTVRVRIKADDGAIVWVNGVQVARMNMGFGASGPTATAWSAITTPGGGSREIAIPASLFTAGANRVAVELHQATAADTDAYFDAELVGARKLGDTTAPASPTPVSATTRVNTAIAFTWPIPADADVVGYELKRDGQVIAYAPRNENTYFDQMLQSGTSYTYTVTAYDAAGNRSASASAALTTTGNAPAPTPLALATPASVWRVTGDATAPPATWTTTGDLSAWTSGSGSFGLNLGATTPLPATSVTHYLATDVTVATPGTYKQIELTYAADDGAVVRINGVEVTRSNLPFGTPTAATLAWAPRTGAPSTTTVRVPASMLVAGTNRISIELHQAAVNDVDSYASLTANALPDNGDAVAPMMTTGTTSNISRTAIQLNWAAATDDKGIGYYLVNRGGVFLTVLKNNALNYYDQQLTPGTAYTYTVIAVDTNGNPSAPVTLTASTKP